MEQELRFRIKYLKEASEFFFSLPQQVQDKITYNMLRVMGGERNSDLFKKLGSTEIWEFRTLYDKKAYRLFAFWDKDEETFVVATHGIVKKSQKTPLKEIAKAEAIREEYLANKQKTK